MSPQGGWMERSKHQKVQKGRDSVCVCYMLDWQYQDTRPMGQEVSGFLHHNQSIKDSILRRVTPSISVCFVCRAVVNTFSSLFVSEFDLPLLSTPYTVPSALFWLLRTAAASAKLEKKDTVAWTQNKCCTDKYIEEVYVFIAFICKKNGKKKQEKVQNKKHVFISFIFYISIYIVSDYVI